MSDEILSRIAGWCLADPKLTFVEEGPAVEVAGEPPLRLDLAVTGEEVLLSHRMSLAGAGEGALAQAMALVNKRGSLLRGTAEVEGGGLAVGIEYPIYLDGLTRQNFLLATQELAAAADARRRPGHGAPRQRRLRSPRWSWSRRRSSPPAGDGGRHHRDAGRPAAAGGRSSPRPMRSPPAACRPGPAPDPNLQPVARLEARVQLRVDERRGAWARVTGSNGWTGWVDDRRLVASGRRPAVAAAATRRSGLHRPGLHRARPTPRPDGGDRAAAGGVAPTHQVPAGGMPAWASPDPAAAPIAELAARVQLRIDETRGAWARVTGSNGWTGWVDARRLGPLGGGGGGGAMALGGLALRPLPLHRGHRPDRGHVPVVDARVSACSRLVRQRLGLALPILWNISNPGDQPRIGPDRADRRDRRPGGRLHPQGGTGAGGRSPACWAS